VAAARKLYRGQKRIRDKERRRWRMVGWEEEVEVLIEKRDNASGRGSCLFGTTLPHGCVFPVWTRFACHSANT
jgi:hypothetical protein